jgi:hypothetical protein
MLTSYSFLCSQRCDCSITLQTTAQSWDLRVRRCLTMSFLIDDIGNSVVAMQKVLWNSRETFSEIQVLSPFLRCNLLTSMGWNANWPYFLLLCMLGHRILPCYQIFDWILVMVDLSEVLRIAWKNFSKMSETGFEIYAFVFAPLKRYTHIRA